MSERTPMRPVPGLSKPDILPGPPARRPRRLAPQAVPGELPAPSPQASVEGASRRKASAAATTLRDVTLSLPVSLVQALRRAAAAEQATHAEFLMDALTATQGHLADLVSATRPQIVKDGLFVRRAEARRGIEGPMTTLSVRMLSPNVDVIDRLVAQLEAPSRSQLCAVALASYLQARPRS